MASRAPKGKLPDELAAEPPTARSLAAASGSEPPVASRAQQLQTMLEARLSQDFEPPGEGKWPPAATLGFIIVTCGGFWAAVIFAASRLL
jgi:hypothetical protein